MFRYSLIRFLPLVIFSNILLSGCVFESEDEYFNELEIPDPTKIDASIKVVNLATHPPGDTIDLFGTTFINYSLSGSHGEIEATFVYLSDDGVSWEIVTSTATNSFILSKGSLSNGIFVLMLDITTKTGSGSLADAVGSEKFKITQKWIVRVDLNPPPQPEPTLTIEDGFLTLRWPAYTKPNFESYIVKRTLPTGARQTFEIKNKQTTWWRDMDYVGGHTQSFQYSVSTVSEIGTTTSVTLKRTDPIEVNFSFNVLDSTVTLEWEPSKFYGTFKEYEFNPSAGQDKVAITDINLTTLSYKLSTVRFGGQSNVYFTVRSKSEGIPEYGIRGQCTLGTPLPFKPFGRIKFNHYLNRFIAVDEDNKMVEINENLQPGNVIATLESSGWRMPYPGQYIYTYSDKTIHRLNLEDNSKVSYDYFYLSYRDSHTVSGNGLICIDYTRPSNPVLFVTKVLDPGVVFSNIYYESSNTTNVSAIISEDGQFIWVNNSSVFRISGGTTELVGSFPGTETFLGFREDNCNEMLFHDGEKINIYDTNTLAYIRSISPPAVRYSFTSYDTHTKNMLWTGGSFASRVYVVNIETGATKSIPISSNATSSNIYIANGYMIYDDNYIKVEL